MTASSIEFFKALAIISLFACLWGVARLAFTRTVHVRLKVTLGSFLALMMLPSSYMYTKLAFPDVAEHVLIAHQFAIWFYGPLLLSFMHALLHAPLPRWQITIYVAPLVLGVTTRIALYAMHQELPAWWELAKFAQAIVFAVVALVWAIRRSAQLKILATSYSKSSFYHVMYLSVGLLALLAVDFCVHFMLYVHQPPSIPVFYVLVTPCAAYVMVISLTLVWRLGSTESEQHDDVAVAELVTQHDQDTATKQDRVLELSDAVAQQLTKQLEYLIHTKRLHTRNDLSLSDMANELGISTHLTSELLNCHLSTSFYEFLNRHRAAEAATLLRGASGQISVTDVAYEAGFNNPNTFYREFKRVYGVTPAHYRRVQQEPDKVVKPQPTAIVQ